MATDKQRDRLPSEDEKKPAKAAESDDRETTAPKQEATEPAADEEQRPDFGGLPDRNLKKNLGCG